MEIIRIDADVTAFIHPDNSANVGLISTPVGRLLIDTTSSPLEMRTLLDAVSARADEVQTVVNTHSHSDHTWGNQLFTCPILAHRLCRQQMESNLENEWSQPEIQAYLIELEKTDPQKVVSIQRSIKDLRIQLPNRVFEEKYNGELGGLKYELIHMSGHTPDLSVVWLPDKRVLFASDLIFQGRYPFIFNANIPVWIARLGQLLKFDARVIIPGHGVKAGEAEIQSLRQYLQQTWERTEEHIRLGHSAEEAMADSAYPIYAEDKRERLHKANIGYMYEQLVKSAADRK
jgi:cyclase